MSAAPAMTVQELQLARKFADRKFTATQDVLGSGHFSEVYVHPTREDLVVKVSSESNDGGVMYAFWARAHQDMVGVPQILDIHQETFSSEKYGVPIEQTTTIITMKRYDEVVQKDKSFPVVGTKYNAGELTGVLSDVLYWVADDADYRIPKATTQLEEKYLETAKAIAKFFAGASSFDLHYENAMIDYATGVLVITDPLSFNKDRSGEVLEQLTKEVANV